MDDIAQLCLSAHSLTIAQDPLKNYALQGDTKRARGTNERVGSTILEQSRVLVYRSIHKLPLVDQYSIVARAARVLQSAPVDHWKRANEQVCCNQVSGTDNVAKVVPLGINVR